VYDIDAPERAADEANSPNATAAGAGGSSAGSRNDDRGLTPGSSCAGASATGGAGGRAGSTGSGGTSPGSGSGGSSGASGGTGAAGSGSGGAGAGATGGAGGSTGGTGNAGGAGNAGGGGSAGVGGAGNGGPTGGVDAGTAGAGAGGRGGIDAARADSPGAGGSGAIDGGATADTVPGASNDARPTGNDAGAASAWLHTSGNHIYHGPNVFHGRGANFHDTRSCDACAYNTPNVGEIKRRADELIDNWKANFIRLDLESSPAPDNRVQWQGVLDDPTYQADIQNIVSHVSSKGAYVLLSLWIEPTTTANELPTDSTLAIWRKLADLFKNEPRVLYGITNEPRNDPDATVWTAMNNAVAAIREVEVRAGTPQHLVAVQGTQQWARRLDYYITHPITAGGGTNIVYETHVYDAASDFNGLFEVPGQTLPVIIGEFGEQDADALMQRAEAAEIPYLAWTFHGRCPPNLIVDNSAGGCGEGMALVPTAFGQKLKNRLATAW
jgi:endoglucanase